MDKLSQGIDAVLLMETYSQESQDLHNSLIACGKKVLPLVVRSDGFLPEGVISVFSYFLGDSSNNFREYEWNGDLAINRPRYFNQIHVEEFWNISGSNNNGEIHNKEELRGKIFYAEPRHKRYVRVVDWYDNHGQVRSSDHYNRYGRLYARTGFNAKGKKHNMSYFDVNGREIIVENYVTGDIILNYKESVRIFKSLKDFVIFFLKEANLVDKPIYYNSLSTPFFATLALDAASQEDILFWQEDIRGEIPGNMRYILDNNAKRCHKVMVQKKSAYDNMLKLGVDENMVKPLGCIYSYRKENRRSNNVLICTNSDNIEQLSLIVDNLDRCTFHIVALTEMSAKLMAYGKKANVRLYPNAKPAVIDELFMDCDYYLDINHEIEIVSAVQRAFLHNQLILGFDNTAHNRAYLALNHIFSPAVTEAMIRLISDCLDDENLLDEHLAMQKNYAMSEDIEAYKKALS